ncbi:MAG TPA: molecular chaperone TorD family protein [Thermoanaerobaculia bacterium]|nr:molecular chaperone TorD family protein [Thermoanaerobaculia bacterium]
MELFRALGALCESPRPELQGIADLLELGALPTRAAHGDLFLFQLYPYASVYLGAEGMMGGEAGDRIAGFWRALGQTPPPEPDHLALMLGLQARLSELEAAAEAADGPERERPAGSAGYGDGNLAAAPAAGRWRHARAAFLWEHLLCWLPLFLGKLAGLAAVAAPFYLRWGALLRDALREEAAALRLPARLPLHLRAAPGIASPRDEEGGPQAFLRSLLSPVRSGMILTRADLARAARDLDLAPRAGERRLALETMLDQDAAAALAWLGAEAAAWAGRHQPELHFAPQLADFWRARAEATARLLGDLWADL